MLLNFVVKESLNRLLGTLKRSYSQCGEDIEIDRLLGNKGSGFYVDVGAYDPSRFNNTKRFYKKGWRGINIEPNPTNYKRFFEERKRDTNLNIAIGPKNSQTVFYSFVPDTSSTTSKRESEKNKNLGYKLISNKIIQVRTLEAVLKKHTKGKSIDFISIDVEGQNLQVLKSNNWEKFRPTVICIETATDLGIGKIKKTKKRSTEKQIDSYLRSKNYAKKHTNDINSIYISRAT